jgi:hypothetical protein
MRANRQLVSDWLGQYDQAGIKVVLSVLGSPPSAPRAAANNEEFATWIADLVAAHSSVAAATSQAYMPGTCTGLVMGG